MFKIGKLLTTLAVSTLVAVAVTACSTPSEPATDGEITTVTVAYNPGSYMAALFLGNDQGVFAANGLELELVPQSDVAAIISGVASGQYDFGFGTILHEINARSNGVPVKIVATVFGNQRDGEERETDSNALVARPGSGITSVADLEGKRLGIIGLSSFHTLELYEYAEREGFPADSVTLVQLPFPQMASSLASGDVDAVIIQSPFIADALELGGTVIAKPNNELFPGSFTTGFITRDSNIEQRPDVVAAFNTAMFESVELLQTDEAGGREMLVENMGLDSATAEIADVCVDCAPAINRDDVERIQNLMVKYGLLEEALPVDDLIWSEAR